MKKYKIVDNIFEFEFISKDYFKRRLESYQIETEEATQYYVVFKLVKELNSSTGVIIKNNSNGIRYQEEDKIVDDLYLNNELITKVFYKDNTYQIFIRRNAGLIQDREYVISALIFSEIMRKEKKLVIHASSIRYKENAILFSAPSGIGKSTQSKLWTMFFDDCDIINDDKPVITIENERVYVWGNPWSGKSNLDHNVKYPLKAIIYLKQFNINVIEELSDYDKIKNTMTNLGVASTFEDNNFIIDTCDMLIKLTQMYLLKCTISKESVMKVWEKLYKANAY